MKDLLEKFENKQPEIVFEWHDSETEAKGWVVINSLRGGAAGGGTRMRVGVDKREVESLAKTMEVKFTVAGPAIGGAKSGIDFDPKDPRKKDVLKRWYKAVAPILKTYYGTGGDMNVDEVHEVIPMCKEVGVQHPQEGVFEGHFSPTPEQKTKRIGQLNEGVTQVIESAIYTPDLSRKYNVSDMITGYGVAESVKHYYAIWGGEVSGKKVIVQGWGNVASAAAFFLAQQEAKVVGIIDRVGGLINPEGYSFEEVKELFLNKNGNELSAPNMLTFEEVNAKVWDVNADVFIPCAASRIVQQDQVDRMIKSGLEVVACGANVPFADKEIFFGPIADSTDNQISVVPDFISNCGMARVFAYLMSNDLTEIKDKNIFEDVSATIEKALKNVHAVHPQKTGIAKKAFEIALNQLV
ncbi:MAG TPA: Glu/Leu/Phe/Val dehydrogenase dimerization domain-containing protein [Taishania sp.]|nr:Glu/Leu/Phe/Val dehydrogenase dimerization domain-containing protein [Taishania sp.]